KTAEVLSENKQYLTDLDSPIGDADHGINMDRGFQKVLTQIPTVENNDIGNILKTTGMALVSSVGGVSGPLYGTFYMRAGMSADGKHELTGTDLAAMLESGIEGVLQRGRANLGDKTMIDALQPALEAYQAAVRVEPDNTAEALHVAVQAAEQGMLATVPLIAKKGRASYLGERSVGHQDPGATSSYLILNALLDVLTTG
ncbi:MAG: dihydroxyacetone kinase subunit DhaL, partial [Anaerolineales bacterium]|nr:dihydroxyacetone kinase subunit DhaL [Anaerolineales bacterium]